MKLTMMKTDNDDNEINFNNNLDNDNNAITEKNKSVPFKPNNKIIDRKSYYKELSHQN